MDYKIILLVIGLCAVVYFGLKYIIPMLKCEYDLRKVLKSLKDLAQIFTNDKVDLVLDEIYDILIDAIIFAGENENLGVADFYEVLDFVISNLEKLGVEVGSFEMDLLDKACEIIVSYVKKQYNK